MEAIKILEPYWDYVKRIFVYAQYCAGNDMRAPVCRDFWTWVVIAAFGLALLIVLIIGKRIFREQLEFYRNKKRLEARAIVAPEEVIQAASWQGDAMKGDLETLPANELADKFRQALKKEKVPAASG